MLFDLLAFGFSSSSIIIHCLAAYLSATRATYPRQLAYLLTFVSILSMTLAFWSGIIWCKNEVYFDGYDYIFHN